MNTLEKFKTVEYWNEFLIESESKEDFLDKQLIKNIKKIINDDIGKVSLDSFPLPSKKEIQKHKSSKKRTVYIYPEPHNTYLKMIHWLLQNDKEYANKFCANSYAYQKHKSVRNGIMRLQKELEYNNRKKYIKSDFTDYFNSIKLDILKEKMVQFFRPEDAVLSYHMLQLLEEPKVYVNGQTVQIAQKGVMAGIPISGYLANIYMNDVDWQIYRKHIYYIRYADDVFILTNKVEEDLKYFNTLIEPLGVRLNETKTDTGSVKDGFTVLGFQFKDGEIDIDEAKIQKMFTRIRRRSKWFRVWAISKGVANETMVRTFIKGMNAKLYSNDDEDRLNWSRWYFGSITTTKNIERVDTFLVQHIRYLISGKHWGYKKHSEVKYEYVQKLGFKSLVNSYWNYRRKEKDEYGICN